MQNNQGYFNKCPRTLNQGEPQNETEKAQEYYRINPTGIPAKYGEIQLPEGIKMVFDIPRYQLSLS